MNNYRGARNFRNPLDITQRVLSALSYLTSGMAGFIWLVVAHLRKIPVTSFAKYHIFQSLFLSLILYIANIALSIIISVAQIIPFIGALITNLAYYLLQYPLIFGYSLLHSILIVFYIYLASFALMGKVGRIPVISDWVKQMV